MIQHRYIINKINSILHTWDPIGLTPSDEYDDLSQKVFKRLEEGDSKEQLIEFLDHYLKSFMGLTEVDISDLNMAISKILTEYNSISKRDN